MEDCPFKNAYVLQDWDWFNGRNFCRDRCMDLVSFDTPGEYLMFEEIMKKGTLKGRVSQHIGDQRNLRVF